MTYSNDAEVKRSSVPLQPTTEREGGLATTSQADIVLATLNARYSHSALGLRYLFANLGALQARATMLEFTIHQRAADIAETLLQYQPRIIGLGVYIWNCQEIRAVVSLLKQTRPDIKLILGGPEVSYEWDAWLQNADHIIAGAADVMFAQVCEQLLSGVAIREKFIQAAPLDLTQLTLPYAYYSDQDIRQRVLYVEASRGCPFKCEFCLSALDKTAYPFDLDVFLHALEELWQRGARRFKFVDRTFNLNPAHGAKILEFFLQRLDSQTFLHFELIPDYLPAVLKNLLPRFPAGSVQFEIGVQSFNPAVQQRISRKQDNAKTEANLGFLREHTHAHLHVDLIIGLPGETLESFAAGFDRLVKLKPHEIQVGLLKRLRGAPISRHSAAFAMRYEEDAPYSVIQTSELDFLTLQRLGRFARYWDLIANSGRFPHSLPVLLGEQPFARFMALSDWLYGRYGQTHKIALERLFTWMYQGLTECLQVSEACAQNVLQSDFLLSQMKKYPDFLPPMPRAQRAVKSALPERQARHARAAPPAVMPQ
jgi:radical SAM superfamily enzyme YgiQ (UPF0313 family)